MKTSLIASVLSFSLMQAQQAVPRLPDGSPDLGGKGIWYPRRLADVSVALEVPFLPWAKNRFEENRAGRHDDTEAKCLPPGVPRLMFTPQPFEIVQEPGRIIFIYEGGAHVWRFVWMDGRSHPREPNPSWMGDSIGHWEGGTLVVDGVGFNDKTWLDDAGHPHTEQLHVIERYTRISPSAMKYQVTIDDPGAYSKPWSNSTTITFRPGEPLEEYICLEGERDTRHAAGNRK
jgi:hypothetical protein